MKITSTMVNGYDETITHHRDVTITEAGEPWADTRIAALNLDAFAREHDGDFQSELRTALRGAGYALASFFSLGPSHVEATVERA